MQLADFRPTKRNVIQFVEYMVGGGVYFWTGYGTFALLFTGFGWHWFPAKVICDIVGSVCSYFVQRYWTFANRKLIGKDTAVIKKYSFISVVSYGLDYLIIWALYSLGVSPYLGFFIAAGFFVVWNYLWYRFWVFYVKGDTASKEVV